MKTRKSRIPALHPDLLPVLRAADRGGIRLTLIGEYQRRLWLVDDRPNTAAVQCLLDAGLVEETPDGADRPITVTDKGRAVLDHLNADQES